MDGSNRDDSGRGIAGALIPLLESWRVLLVVAVVAAVGAATVRLLLPRSYDARVQLVTVNSSKLPNISGSFAAAATLLGAGAQGAGLQATPALVVKFADLDGVLRSVALQPVRDGDSTRVIERLARKPLSRIPGDQIQDVMRHYVQSSFDRNTGIITVEVVHRDSAVARIVAGRLVDATRGAFLRAARAQASELRRAQTARVDSASRQLAHAEDALLDFSRANRQLLPYSEASIQRSRLQRNVDIAQNLYTQAVGDQQSAVAKELEETPAVVVVDSVPAEIPVLPRHTVTLTLGAAFFGMVLAAAFLLGRAAVRASVREGDSTTIRALAALGTVPLVGRFARAAIDGRARPVPTPPFSPTSAPRRESTLR